jgi:hypothetical protein
MKSLNFTEVLDAAAYALVAERCRQAYLHDIRGGLQAINTAIELLSRSAKDPVANGALIEKAAALAQRALATHEQTLIDLVKRMAPSDEPVSTVDLSEVLQGALHFLRNDAFAKSISYRLALTPGVLISTQADKCRLLMLGLNAMAIDALETGSIVEVGVSPAGSDALVELTFALPYSLVRNTADFGPGRSALPAYELMLALSAQWAGGNGGRVELASAEFPKALRIYYPMAAIGRIAALEEVAT